MSTGAVAVRSSSAASTSPGGVWRLSLRARQVSMAWAASTAWNPSRGCLTRVEVLWACATTGFPSCPYRLMRGDHGPRGARDPKTTCAETECGICHSLLLDFGPFE